MPTKTPAKKAAAPAARARPLRAVPAPGKQLHRFMPGEMEDLVRSAWYGDPGFGKSTALASLANVGPIYYLDPEQRLKVRPLQRLGINTGNITRVTDCSYGALKKLFEQVGNEVADGNRIAGVAWDAIGEQQRVFTQDLVDAGVKTAATKGYERNEYRTYKEDYGDATEIFRRLMRTLYRIDCHIGVTVHAKRDVNEEDEIVVNPDLTPAFLRDFRGAMDIIGYLQMEAVGDAIERAGLYIPLGRYEAKDTFGVLPRRLVNPSFERILGYVTGELTPANDAEQKAARALRRDQEKKADKE